MRPSIVLIILATVLFVLFSPTSTAQQAGENINVLPVVVPIDADDNGIADDPDWYIKGDGFLQRQVEPTIAASTLNPDHLLSFFVDYRAVDIADDIGLGETEAMMALFNTGRTIMMAASQLSFPRFSHIELPPIAAAEAWVGMSRSYDGGLTWSGGFLPGAPFDDSPASLASPVYGLQAATDPVLAPGPCGKFYLVFMAFTRGGESKLVVARYQDLNNPGGGEHIVYEGMTVVETGNNATNGHFLDKPDIEVDIFRDANPDICADRVYVSYSTFTGLDADGKFQSKIHVARSFDHGLTFEQTKISPPYTQNQGSALAVDPSNGTLYLVWRHFYSPDAIVMIKTLNYGKKWEKPVMVTSAVPLAPFDQPSISIDDALAAGYASPENPGFPEVAFRSNGFPTATVTGDGAVFAAWQERVGADGRPSETGSPRIVVVRSDDEGRTWTDINGSPDRLAVDMDWRDIPGDPNIPADGFGALPQYRLAGSQVQPKLVFNGGQLLLAFFESRGRIADYGTLTPSIAPADVLTTGFISGYDRLLDFRAALLNPQSGEMTSTIQVSRYPIRGDADLSDGEQLVDVAPVDPNCDPNDEACARQVNLANATQSSSGRIPFIGDYPDVAPVVQFVFDGSAWRWATEATDVPYQGFHAIFTDNRHLLPPPGFDEWNGYQYYDPPWESLPDNLEGCVNGGSRNTDVLTSRIDTSMVLSAPTTFKDLEYKRSFPFSVKNTTGENRSYNLEIIEGMGAASFHRYIDEVHGGDVEVFAYSSGSFLVYINTGYPDPVRVQVSENCPDPMPDELNYECTNSSGILTFNADSGYDIPTVDGPDTQFPELVGDPFFIVAGDSGDLGNPFVVNPFVVNPFVVNPFVVNPFVVNPFVVNPFVVNPFVVNPFVVNANPEDIEAVIDTTWTISPGASNTASSYLPVVNIDNAQAFIDAGYVFQLIVYKGSLYGGIVGCEGINRNQPQILANVVQDPGAESPFVVNPFVVNPFVVNPFVVNPFVVNSSFTMAPADNLTVPDDGTTKADPASDEVMVTLRAFRMVPAPQGSTADGGSNLKLTEDIVFKPWLDPPSMVIVPQTCDPDDPGDPYCEILTVSPDLVPFEVDFGGDEITARAGGMLIDFPTNGWTLANTRAPVQEIGDATAENGILRHGFYICDMLYIDSYNTDLPLDVTNPACTFAEVQPSGANTLALGATEYFGPADISIPNMDEGHYYLVLVVDDTLQVSERTENNNWVKHPIFIEEPNEPPVATDTAFVTDEDTPLSDALPATDPDGDPLTFTLTSGATSGTVNLTGGDFTFTPNPNFHGSDSFAFEIFDGEFTAGATVSIDVTPVNDPPVVTVGQVVVNEDATAQVIVTATDVDGDTISYDITTAPTKGSVSPINSDTGVFTYTPDPDLNGTDTFSVTVGDTTVDVTVTVDVSITAVADAPVADNATNSTIEDTAVGGTLTATDADGDALTYSLVTGAANGTAVVNADGSYIYIPDADFNGTESFTFKANDGVLDSNTATVTITVTPVNDPPIASDAFFEAFENTPLNGFLIGSDIDGDTVSFSIASAPAFGTAVVDPATGAFTYTPMNSHIGIDTFVYAVSDGSDPAATGVVTINVIDPVPNWDFIGFASPWRPGYKVKAGSAIPLKWYYTDPDTGAMVDSSTPEPPEPQLEIRIIGYPGCDPDGTPITSVEDPGSSDLRYVDGNWQFNWDTVGLPTGCYELSVYHPVTNQIDRYSDRGDPLDVKLK